MITESNFEQSESSSKMAMMAETTETRVIMTEISEDNDNSAAETMLARKHLAQKHHYPSDKAHGADIPQSCIESQTTSLAVEAAVSIVINGIHYAVLMASPYQLEYLAVGFLFSEGLIQHSHELLDWEVTHLTDIASYQKFAQSLNDGDLEFASIEQRLESTAAARPASSRRRWRWHSNAKTWAPRSARWQSGCWRSRPIAFMRCYRLYRSRA